MGSPSESTVLPEGAPRWFGKYEVLRHLATGGMAEIYLARTSGIEGFEKTVVIKRMLPILASEPECVRLFLNEARLAAQLQHANIVQVHDVGSEDGSYFIAMEFVHGVDVRAIAARARQRGIAIPIDVALAIATDVCAGLHYAHECKNPAGRPLSIVHCDISPSNVLVAFDGVAKVADFGIAKAGGTSKETRQSALRGKFGYMSPEQCLGEPLDRRNDVYAIALLVAEMTCGQKLFTGPSDFEIMKRIIEKPPPKPTALMPGYPKPLEAIVLRGLSRDRAARWPTAQDLQIALERFGRDRNLAVSSVSVARYLHELFVDDLEALRGGDLSELTASLISATPEPTPATVPQPMPPARQVRRGRRVAIGVLAAAFATVAGIAIVRDRHDSPTSPAAAARVRAPAESNAGAPAETIATPPPPPAAAAPVANATKPPSTPSVAGSRPPRTERDGRAGKPTPARTKPRVVPPSPVVRNKPPATVDAKPWDPDAVAPP